MSLDNLFSRSIKGKKFERFSHLDVFAKQKFEVSGFKESVRVIQSSIDFLSEDIKVSKKSEEVKFTNFLAKSTPTEISNRIYELFNDPSIINNSRAGQVSLTTEKIKKCIGLYFDIVDEDNTIIFKSQISDTFGNQAGVRVYAIADVNKEHENPRAEYKIVLIDPFHLVIPSAHTNKKGKKYSKEEMEANTFTQNKHNTISMHEFFDEFI